MNYRRPGDDLFNAKFIGIYAFAFVGISLPQYFYFTRTDDQIHYVALGICEFIQMLIFNVTIISVLFHRKEFKKLVTAIAEAFKGFLVDFISMAMFESQNLQKCRKDRWSFGSITKKFLKTLRS